MNYGIKRIYTKKPLFSSIDNTHQPNGGYEVWYAGSKVEHNFSYHSEDAVVYIDINLVHQILRHSPPEWIERVEELP